jgi:putative FmdB family regulatory protein
MPTYEYKCDACGTKFERFQSITADPIKKCPKCGKNKVRRLISTGAGLIFKGSGFYITDYRDKSYADKAKAESSGGDKKESGDSKTDTKSDTKTDTKTETKAESQSSEKTPAKSESKPAKTESKPRKKRE